MSKPSCIFVALFIASAAHALHAQAAAPRPPFTLSSNLSACNRAYEKARRVIAADVKDGKFLAGQNWAQVWTRDTSYSTELACAILHPDVAKTTLLDLTQQV